ncbi:MAG: FAD-binding oxidoreductase [Rhodobacteraceae bacterium]|nr:FAD-binding oxidoreductase [Paracoccaceae bacterium]
MTDRARVVIVGGGIMGSFAGWSLRQEGFAGQITVVERDPSYRFSSTALSAAAIRTQFGTPVNIGMSLHAARLFRQISDHFGPDADIGYREKGYLILAPPEAAAAREAAVAMQLAEGADIEALTPADLAARFPWLDLTGIGIGTFGRSGEGWFDAWSLLTLVQRAAKGQGVRYVTGEVAAFDVRAGRIAALRVADGTAIPCDWCVLAAGAASPDFPMLFDTSGVWVRPEGEGFIGGIQPPPDRDPDATGDFEPDHALLEDLFWPALAARVTAMERLRLDRAWAGHYEVNALDHNGVVGPHDAIPNLVFCTGFSGHGVMHSPAAGRGVAEHIVHGRFTSLDLSPLGYARIRAGRALAESIVY